MRIDDLLSNLGKVGEKSFSSEGATFENGVLALNTENENEKIVIDSNNGIYMEGVDGQKNSLIDLKQEQIEETPDEVENEANVVSEDTFKGNGWTQTSENKFELDYNGMKVVASILNDGTIMVRNLTNGSIAKYTEGKLTYLYNDIFHNYQEDKIKEENGVYTVGNKSYVLNEYGLLDEVETENA